MGSCCSTPPKEKDSGSNIKIGNTKKYFVDIRAGLKDLKSIYDVDFSTLSKGILGRGAFGVVALATEKRTG